MDVDAGSAMLKSKEKKYPFLAVFPVLLYGKGKCQTKFWFVGFLILYNCSLWSSSFRTVVSMPEEEKTDKYLSFMV